MFELMTLIVFVWLMSKVIGMTFRLTWGAARVIASILMAIAVPMLVVCLVFVGGAALLLPVAVIGLAFWIGKACA